jgi:ferritin-like metal-binding protein YciE
MTEPQDHLSDWLRDAHAMEEQAETMLKAMAGRLENYPELKVRIEQHVTETQNQARLLTQCIERRGDSTSTVKDLAGKTMASAQGFAGMFATDEVVKGGMASYAFEHFEIAAYRALIQAAETAGDPETKGVCEQILAEEQEMADWLEENLPAVVHKYLTLSADPDATAKR